MRSIILEVQVVETRTTMSSRSTIGKPDCRALLARLEAHWHTAVKPSLYNLQDGSISSQYISSPITHGYIYPSKTSNYFFPFLLVDPFRGVFVALDETACCEAAGADTGLGVGLTAGLAAP